ncbi:uncharacterized protein A4U43_C07F27430 [Asparagus officinalis]|uniref:Large ribosomal subunit protein bL17c n=1 Tax=Asparagus officinalis TaxID=4686 RepID=A0A5P1EFB6_ASPOF|nr:uncharacterized protein LOC109849870 [Asparagus officinalis]ONK64566.1 uncharacterized protein A4U43_C07F27430 [Asparagus officinalis]
MAMAASYSSSSTVVSLPPFSMASLRSALPPLPAARVHFSSPKLRTGGGGIKALRSFSGLAPVAPFLSSDSTGYEQNFLSINNGSKFYAMRHGRRVPKLNRPPDQRKALLRGLTTQLLKHGRIKTTRARASAVRKYVDKMITLAKDGSLHKRRQALGFIYEKQIVHALFAEVEDRYGERNGGYTRIIRTLPRRGDNAPMAYIELV